MNVASFALLALDQRGCLVVEWLASLVLEAILLERREAGPAKKASSNTMNRDRIGLFATWE